MDAKTFKGNALAMILGMLFGTVIYSSCCTMLASSGGEQPKPTHVPKVIRGVVVKTICVRRWLGNDEYRMAVDTENGRKIIEWISDYEVKRAQVKYKEGDIVEFDSSELNENGEYRPNNTGDVKVIQEPNKERKTQ
jgi:hypothetical protein